jgi:hypothetical protein
MTNRELLRFAMPLKKLSTEQWDSVWKHLEKLYAEQPSSPLYLAFVQLLLNQSRIEISNNYNDYYFDTLDEVAGKNACEIRLI